jgi:hypothetical protein
MASTQQLTSDVFQSVEWSGCVLPISFLLTSFQYTVLSAHHPQPAGKTTMEIFPGAYVAKQSLTAAIFLGAIIITILAYRIDSSVREVSAGHPNPAFSRQRQPRISLPPADAHAHPASGDRSCLPEDLPVHQMARSRHLHH